MTRSKKAILIAQLVLDLALFVALLFSRSRSAFATGVFLLLFLLSSVWTFVSIPKEIHDSKRMVHIGKGVTSTFALLAVVVTIFSILPLDDAVHDDDLLSTAVVGPDWNACGESPGGFVFDHRKTSDLPALPTPDRRADITEWAADAGGKPATPIRIRLTESKRGPDAAIVTSIKPINIIKKSAAPGLYAYVIPEPCGGNPTPVVAFSLDLDHASPSLRFLPAKSSSNGSTFPRTVTRESPDIYDILIVRTKGDFSFDLEVHWEVAGEKRSTIENNQGAHFNLASTLLSSAASVEAANLSQGFMPATIFPDLDSQPLP